MALTAVCLLLTTGNPRGAAVHSPLLQELPERFLPAQETVEDAAVPLSDGIREPEPEPEPEPRYGLVPESGEVEDAYFDDAVFLGDSRTDGFRLYSGLDRGTYLCATGATVQSVFTREADTPLGRLPLLDALARTECGKIYVMLGVNELGWPGTDLFREHSRELLQRIQADHPGTPVLLQAILPVSARQDAKGSYVNNQRVREYNQVLRELAEELKVYYVAVDEPLTGEDGCLPAELNFDGVHLNPAGCAIWLDYLQTHAVMPPAAE